MAQVILDVIFRMYDDHNKDQPSGDARNLKLLSWYEHFNENGVPWEAVPKIYSEAVKKKAATGFGGIMPTIGEIVKEWESQLESGYWERNWEAAIAPTEEDFHKALPMGENPLPGGVNTISAPLFVKEFGNLAARGESVTCYCVGDKFCHNGRWAATLVADSWSSFWRCAKGKCDFEMKGEDVNSIQSVSKVPAPNMPRGVVIDVEPLEEIKEYADDMLIDLVIEKTGLNFADEDWYDTVDFARHMLGIVPPDLWTITLGRNEWKMWKAKERKE